VSSFGSKCEISEEFMKKARAPLLRCTAPHRRLF
jgi:hypothetical protein